MRPCPVGPLSLAATLSQPLLGACGDAANLAPGSTVFVEMWGRLQADQAPAGYADCTGGCLVSLQEVLALSDAIVITDLNPAYVGN